MFSPLETLLKAVIYEMADYMSLSKYKKCKNLRIYWIQTSESDREAKNLKMRILKPRSRNSRICLVQSLNLKPLSHGRNFVPKD